MKIDSAGLDPSYGEVRTLFLPVISDGGPIVSTTARAVAGASAIAVMPFAVCAMNADEKRSRNGELEEFGFRRGVSYDLMQLNPEASGAGQTFLIHPYDGPGSAPASPADFNTVAPSICTGVMGIARVMGGRVPVSTPFPLNEYHEQFNSRFDSYTLPCIAGTAPPDRNIKQYKFDDGSVPWMAAITQGQASDLREDTVAPKR